MKKNFLGRFLKTALPLFFSIGLLTACQPSGQATNEKNDKQEAQYVSAIQAIFEQDNELGATRNRACEDTSLSVTIRQYVAGLDAFDFSKCPDDFANAFRKHQDAWERSISFFSGFDDLRGEMHDLFDQIKEGDEQQKVLFLENYNAIMDTWAEVEVAARKYGALEEE